MSSGPLSAVSGERNLYAGGFFGPTNPTSIPGSLGTPGAQGFPAPGQLLILSARNNSGSNVRIPYARLVPMRGESALQSHRPASTATGAPPARGRSATSTTASRRPSSPGSSAASATTDGNGSAPGSRRSPGFAATASSAAPTARRAPTRAPST